jgi:hypothetical protein
VEAHNRTPIGRKPFIADVQAIKRNATDTWQTLLYTMPRKGMEALMQCSPYCRASAGVMNLP